MSNLVLKIIKFYQKNISPSINLALGFSSGCRFYPNCSEYSYQAISELGLLKGSTRSIIRIAKCNPLFPGGVDLV